MDFLQTYNKNFPRVDVAGGAGCNLPGDREIRYKAFVERTRNSTEDNYGKTEE